MKQKTAKVTGEHLEFYRELKSSFKSSGGKFLYSEAAESPVTFAVLRVGNYVHIAVAVCGVNDKPNKKRGKFEALCKLYEGNYVPLTLKHSMQINIGGITRDDILTALNLA